MEMSEKRVELVALIFPFFLLLIAFFVSLFLFSVVLFAKRVNSEIETN